jgi:hypothetical protein
MSQLVIFAALHEKPFPEEYSPAVNEYSIYLLVKKPPGQMKGASRLESPRGELLTERKAGESFF